MDKYVANGASLLQCTHVHILQIALMHNGGLSKGRGWENKESAIRKLLLSLCYTRQVYVEE